MYPHGIDDEVPLACFLGQPGARPERQRHRVVLVEHLVDRLRQERRRVAGVLAHGLRDRQHLDPQPLAQQLLVAARLDLIARKARGMEHEDHFEATLGGVRHEPLELRPPVRLAPPGMKVAVLADDDQVVLVGEPRDRLTLRLDGKPGQRAVASRLPKICRGSTVPTQRPWLSRPSCLMRR
jgi:hypothetical protein